MVRFGGSWGSVPLLRFILAVCSLASGGLGGLVFWVAAGVDQLGGLRGGGVFAVAAWFEVRWGRFLRLVVSFS